MSARGERPNDDENRRPESTSQSSSRQSSARNKNRRRKREKETQEDKNDHDLQETTRRSSSQPNVAKRKANPNITTTRPDNDEDEERRKASIDISHDDADPRKLSVASNRRASRFSYCRGGSIGHRNSYQRGPVLPPPVAVFKPFTRESMSAIQARMTEESAKKLAQQQQAQSEVRQTLNVFYLIKLCK